MLPLSRPFILIALAAAGALPGAAAGQPAPAPGEDSKDGPVFGAWKIACEEGATCQAYVSLVSADTKQLALTFSYHFVKGLDRPTGVATLPLGLALKPGVQILTKASAEPIRLEPEVCYPDGCRAVFNPTPDEQAALTGGDSYAISFFAYGLPDRRTSIEVPADGLAEALDYLARNNAAD
jgi:invasion protein IalB